MSDNIDQCRVADCDRPGFMVVNTDDEMLCMNHYNGALDISYLNEPEEQAEVDVKQTRSNK